MCSGNFYDSGGSGNSYSNNENNSVTFCSNNENSIEFNFTYFDIEYHNSCSYDKLRIYDGSSISATLLGTYCGTNSPRIITSSGTCLHFVFSSDNNIIDNGWAASISCVTSSSEICNNGIDDDGDGLIDCEDPDCYLSANSGDTDNDGDGCDLDDDNDGILDLDECAPITAVLNSFTALYPSSIPFSGLVVGNRLLQTNALTYLGESYDLVLEITGTNIPSTPASDIINLSSGKLRIESSVPAQDSYVLYDLIFIPTGTATQTSVLTPSTIKNIVISLYYIDGNNNTGLGDIMGVSNSGSVETSILPGVKLTNSSFVSSSGPGSNYNYFRPVDLNGFTTVINASGVNLDYSVDFTYATYNIDNFAYGVTGNQTSINGAREQSVILISNDACDTDNDGITNRIDTDSDNDGCPDAIESEGSFSYSDINNDMLIGGVGNNGVPNVAGSGQTIGESQNLNIVDCPIT